MTAKSLSGAIAMMAVAGAAAADPCVGPTFDRPLPGALDVKTFVSDVPSAQYPAFWQQGTLDGYRYVVFANLEGTLRSNNPLEEWGVTITCDAAAGACETTTSFTVPDAASAVTDRLAQCLLGAAPVSEPEPATEPEPIAEPETVAQAISAPEPAPCGLALVTEENDIATLQRLLTLAGQDPGPVDGFLGQQTFTAMNAFVPNADWGTSITDTIAVVDAFLCQPSD
ncbi:MAG: peptidoglycan-binding domain-containing protein [Yoonia sp.]|uniref:peptidoglycan-binding domain-containing protein n=1 Tax=Yoonia sp. TaxID=2212373 RepID=UPI003EF95892